LLPNAPRADFATRTEGFTYVSPLSPEQQPPLELPEWLNADGSAETMAGMAQRATV